MVYGPQKGVAASGVASYDDAVVASADLVLPEVDARSPDSIAVIIRPRVAVTKDLGVVGAALQVECDLQVLRLVSVSDEPPLELIHVVGVIVIAALSVYLELIDEFAIGAHFRGEVLGRPDELIGEPVVALALLEPGHLLDLPRVLHLPGLAYLVGLRLHGLIVEII